MCISIIVAVYASCICTSLAKYTKRPAVSSPVLPPSAACIRVESVASQPSNLAVLLLNADPQQTGVRVKTH